LVRSPWIKWSWLLVVAVVVAHSLSYHWRVLPTSAQGYWARGRADFISGDFESAVDNLTKSIAKDPTDADAYIYRGEAYAKLHEFAKAIPDIEKALQLRPDYAKSHAASADVKVALWDSKGAFEGYSRALELDPEYARCYLERGMLSYDAERWRDAEADFRQSARLRVGANEATSQLFVWLARARAGDAAGASDELWGVLPVAEAPGDQFSVAVRFLSGRIAEPDYLAGLAKLEDDDVDRLKAEGFFLAGGRRLAIGDRAVGLAMMRNALAIESDSSYARDRARVELETALVGLHPKWIDGGNAGLAIDAVTPGGPAEAAGIRPGWVLETIDGTVASQESFVEFLASAEPGSTAELQLGTAEGKRVTVPLTLTPGSSAPTR
jgi:tetratricopeptide (TPR) repeat protein